MGDKNSSLTRVQPLFDYIGVDLNKLNKFLSLFEVHTQITEPPISIKYGFDETAIKPPRELLIWCINNVEKLNSKEFQKLKEEKSVTAKKRYALFCKDGATISEALEKLKEPIIPQSDWFVFEGYTHPDIFIETKNSIYIGEAKRTENRLTEHTKWLKDRDQLIRHVDSVIDGNKKVFSFFIVEEPQKYDFSKYKENEIYEKSLPHRTEQIKNLIKKTYIGYTTFREVNNIFNNEVHYRDNIYN